MALKLITGPQGEEIFVGVGTPIRRSALYDMETRFDPDQPRDEHGRWLGSGSGDSLTSELAKDHGAKLDESDITPSFTTTKAEVLYHATGNPRVEKTGLKASTPPEIKQETDPEDHDALSGVYLTTKEGAEKYLAGRLQGNGRVVAVGVPEGTTLYQDPIDLDAVFVKGNVPASAIYRSAVVGPKTYKS